MSEMNPLTVLDLDPKQKILFTAYAEYLRPVPSPAEITPKYLEMKENIFQAAVHKLANEGLINLYGNYKPYCYNLENASPTLAGIKYVEGVIDVRYDMSELIKAGYLKQRSEGRGWKEVKKISELAEQEQQDMI